MRADPRGPWFFVWLLAGVGLVVPMGTTAWAQTVSQPSAESVAGAGKPAAHAEAEKTTSEHRHAREEAKPPVVLAPKMPQRPVRAQKPHVAGKPGGGSVSKGAPTVVGPPPPPPGAPPGPPLGPSEAAPPTAEGATTPAETANGVKLPQFAALRSDDVNMRAGPGTRFRIEWVYKRRDMPVEILREYDVWRWVRDPEGIEGWVHTATLTQRRSFIVRHGDASLRSGANDTAPVVAILKAGVIGRIRSCEPTSAWCWLQVASYRGYLRRDQFWGTLPGEAVTP